MNQESELFRGLAVRPESLQYYLSRTGWKESAFSRKDVSRYELSDDRNVFVLVPKNTLSTDYRESVWQIVRTISQIEDRDLKSVFKNISTPNLDSVKLRFMGAGSESGSLSLDYIRSAIENIRDSLIFSACSEYSPQPAYSQKLNDAVKLIKKARFGQTEVGSFVVNIEMPLDIPLPALISKETTKPPIERRVLSRLIKGVAFAKKIVTGAIPLDHATNLTSGLNANLAESLAALKRADRDFQIELSANWDKTLPVQADIPTEPVLIEERTFETLASIGHALRGPSVSKEIEASGHIVELSRKDIRSGDETDDSDNLNEAERTITLQTSIDGQSYKLRIVLFSEDYVLACDAHRDRRRVSVKGVLEKSGNRWLLTSYQDFKKTI